MKNMIQNIVIWTAITGVFSLGVAQQPAAALITDPTSIFRLQTTRNTLLQKETKLLRDQDVLNRQIWDIKRQNDPATNPLLNDLSNQLDDNFNSLQKTRWQIRQIENALL